MLKMKMARLIEQSSNGFFVVGAITPKGVARRGRFELPTP